MKVTWYTLVAAATALFLQPARGQQPGSATANAEVDPLVKASPYGDKSTWSYSNFDSQPIPWALFKPNDFSSVPITFDSSGIRSVGQVPAPGVHPRIFFSPEDLPALRKRLESTAAGQAAWKNILSISNLLRLTYDEKADYAKPDWVKGDFGGIHGRFPELANLGGYHHPDYYTELAAGTAPTSHYEHFSGMAPVEGFRCLVEDDANGAHKLAAAIVTWVKLKQEQRAKVAKPIKEGEPPKLDIGYDGEYLALTYDFIYQWMTNDQKQLIHDELVLISAWHDNYGTFNNADNTRSNWATFSYWVIPAVAIEGEPGYNDLKVRGLYRGWRNFYSDSYFKSGAVFEGEGKSLQGVDSTVVFDRLAAKYGWQPLLAHPTLRNHYGSFTSLSVQPTLNNFVFFDMLGGVDQPALSTPVDLIVAHYAYPADKRIDFVYRAAVGDDYSRLPHRADWAWPMTVLSAIFATDYDPTNTPESLNLPNTFFCGQRAMMMTRSSWDKDATFLTMHVRGASGGHPYSDRNGIMLTGKGRSWVTIPTHDGQGWKCNTVLIDGREQSRSTPGRVVDFVDRPLATFMVGDAKYCWDWVWSGIGKTKSDKPIFRADVMDGNVKIGPGWKLVDQAFNDFAYTKIRSGLLDLPMKFMPDWIAVDGILSPTTKGINMPVMTAFRTAGLVRGSRPYVVVVDDIQRNCLPSRYDWHLMLLPDLVQIKQSITGALPADVVLAGNKTLAADGTLTPGQPALLIRRIDAQGTPTTTIESVNDRESPFQKGDKGNRTNLLTVSTRAVSPNYKFILYPFLGGEPLPTTTWNAAHTQVSVAFPNQQDTIYFGVNRAGKTDMAITRQKQEIVRVSQPIPPLADPDTAALDQMLQKLPQVIPSLRNFDPQTVPGLVAYWPFDEIKNGNFPAGEPAIPGFPAVGDSSCVEGQIGKAARFPSSGVELRANLKESIKDSFSFSFWVKSDPDPNGVLINLNELNGFSLDIDGGSIRVNAQNNWSYGGKFNGLMITSWTHLAITGDGKTMVIYRDGMPIMSLPTDKPLDFGGLLKLGKGFSGAFDDLRIYNRALDPSTVQLLYLRGFYVHKST